jgi:hypothetical protein
MRAKEFVYLLEDRAEFIATQMKSKISVSTWLAPVETVSKVADAFNRGGFSDVPINRVPIREMAEGFQVYAARVRVKNPLYNTSVEVAVFAKNSSMARALLQAQFGADSVISNVHEISS